MKWISVKDRLPDRFDEDFLIAVKNKNKSDGIFLIDIANWSSDCKWIKSNVWEDITYWRELPEPPKTIKSVEPIYFISIGGINSGRSAKMIRANHFYLKNLADHYNIQFLKDVNEYQKQFFEITSDEINAENLGDNCYKITLKK